MIDFFFILKLWLSYVPYELLDVIVLKYSQHFELTRILRARDTIFPYVFKRIVYRTCHVRVINYLSRWNRRFCVWRRWTGRCPSGRLIQTNFVSVSSVDRQYIKMCYIWPPTMENVRLTVKQWRSTFEFVREKNAIFNFNNYISLRTFKTTQYRIFLILTA